MTTSLFILLVTLLASCSGHLPAKKSSRPDPLTKVAEFKGAQVTGVAISADGRLFASFPRWRQDVPFSVVEVREDGSHVPYPDEEWNTWKGEPAPHHFTSVQSLHVDGNSLYVLDTGNPEMKGIIDRPKLYEFDLEDGELRKTYVFDEKAAPLKAYLNDFRVDDKNQKIYITDSGIGGIIVLDQKTGETRRFLDKHPSTKAEKITLKVDDKTFKRPVNSDGIALSPIDQKLYYHALRGYHLYRVPVEVLDSDRPDETQVVKKVEKLGLTPAPDGMVFDDRGNLYMADLEKNAITYRTPEGKMEVLIKDERLQWPDSFTIDKDNNLIFTDSLLVDAPAGKPVKGMTFKIYKVALP